jgi:hypothetical protein
MRHTHPILFSLLFAFRNRSSVVIQLLRFCASAGVCRICDDVVCEDGVVGAAALGDTKARIGFFVGGAALHTSRKTVKLV